MPYHVYLCQQIYKNDKPLGWYIKPIALHISPFVGLVVCERSIDNERVIRQVWITPKGAVICELNDNRWRVSEDGNDADGSESEWPHVLKYEIDGWTSITNFDSLPSPNGSTSHERMHTDGEHGKPTEDR